MHEHKYCISSTRTCHQGTPNTTPWNAPWLTAQDANSKTLHTVDSPAALSHSSPTAFSQAWHGIWWGDVLVAGTHDLKPFMVSGKTSDIAMEFAGAAGKTYKMPTSLWPHLNSTLTEPTSPKCSPMAPQLPKTTQSRNHATNEDYAITQSHGTATTEDHAITPPNAQWYQTHDAGLHSPPLLTKPIQHRCNATGGLKLEVSGAIALRSCPMFIFQNTGGRIGYRMRSTGPMRTHAYSTDLIPRRGPASPHRCTIVGTVVHILLLCPFSPDACGDPARLSSRTEHGHA